MRCCQKRPPFDWMSFLFCVVAFVSAVTIAVAVGCKP